MPPVSGLSRRYSRWGLAGASGSVKTCAVGRDLLFPRPSHRCRFAISAARDKREKEDTRQRLLGFAEDELRQLEANKRYWAKRLAGIQRELQTEPDRIRDVYQVKARRIEPVGLVYLWPVTG